MRLYFRRVIFAEIQTKELRMDAKKAPLVTKEKAAEQPANNGTTRPKNPSANVLPSEGFVLEIDGKFKSEYETSEAAMKAGLELKKKFPYIQVKVYSAKERTRKLVTLPEQSEKKTEAAL
jgi:hypothetical protein